MTDPRHDYAFPFRIDPGSLQAQQVGYERHVAELVRQVLLTGPGERVDLPEFGCGLRALVFAGIADSIEASAQILVLRSLERWLSDHIDVHEVDVVTDEATVTVRVVYALVRSGRDQTVDVRVA